MALPGYDQDWELVDEDGGGDDNAIGDVDGLNEQTRFHVGGYGRVE
jgi:hypothetical protein